MRRTGGSSLRAHGIRAALVSAMFLGFTPIFGKQAILGGFPPLAVTAFRTALAALLLLLVMAAFHRRFFYIYPVGLIGCVLAGMVNGLGSVLYYSALGRIDASLGQILYAFYPLFTAMWLFIDHQQVSRMTFVRLILAIPAVYLLLNTDQQGVDLLGVGLMLGASVLYALHLLINQRVLYDVPAPTVTLYTLLSMSATTLVAYGLFDRGLPPPHAAWWPILALALVTFLARILLFLGVKHVGGMQTALLGLAELIISISLAVFWLGERLSAAQWLGACLLGASLLLVGMDRFIPERRLSGGWLAWLRPPEIPRDLLPRD